MPVEDHRPCWRVWRIAICGLTLLFVIFPAIMDFSHHDQTSPPSATTETTPMQASTGIKDTCPPLDHCISATVEQALPRLPIPPPSLLALVTLIVAMRWQPRAPAPKRDWWLPPDRRRALLQVFLL